VSQSSTVHNPVVATQPEIRETVSTRRIPPYNVIIDNDDYHSFPFVVEVLRRALGYSAERAHQLTMQAHTTGRAIVWTGPMEVAELKAEQIRSFHEVRAVDHARLGPLHCTIEPAASE
jgi:ATP-dependent Clp protease adaptor protein ClpS